MLVVACSLEGHVRCQSWQHPATPKALAILRRIVVLQLIPGNEVGELDSAIVTRGFAAKRQQEVLA